MLGCAPEFAEAVVARYPRRHLVEHPYARECVAVRLRGVLGWLALVAGARGIADRLKRRGRRGGCRVGGHPTPQRGGVANDDARVAGNVAVDDAVHVTVQLA